MRIVIVGATGNVGTAVLRRLQSLPERPELVGVARRKPDDSAPPYAGVEWHSVDISSPTAEAQLAPVFAGADAVVCLAWLLQPNRDEPYMWKTNVRGTEHVAEAAAAAGVPHFVYASSVGAYSSGPKHRRVSEDWPTGGVHTSQYGRQKAATERALDRIEAAHPAMLVTRIRPGLVLQADAGAEIKRLFLGPQIPSGWMRRPRVLILPLPTRMVSQVVHADDVADAFWRVLDQRAGGAFNLAAEPVIGPAEVAKVMHAKHIPFREPVLRAITGITWRLHLHRTDPGWVELATNIPVMSTARAREVLGWVPQRRSLDVLREMLTGLADRTHVQASPPLKR